MAEVVREKVHKSPDKNYEIQTKDQLFVTISKKKLNESHPLIGEGDPFSDLPKANRNVPFEVLNKNASALVQYPHLSHAGEYALLVRYREYGDNDALTRLLLSNIGYINWLTVRFLYRRGRQDEIGGQLHEEIINEGLLGLVRAIKAYDLERDPPPRLLGFGKWRIQDSIGRESDMDSIRIPERAEKWIIMINRNVTKYINEYGHFPLSSIDDFVEHCFLEIREKYGLSSGEELADYEEDSWKAKRTEKRQKTADDELRQFIGRYLGDFFSMDPVINNELSSGGERVRALMSDSRQNVEEEALNSAALFMAKEYLRRNYKMLGIKEDHMRLYLRYLECDPLYDLPELSREFGIPKDKIIQIVFESRVKLSAVLGEKKGPLRDRKKKT